MNIFVLILRFLSTFYFLANFIQPLFAQPEGVAQHEFTSELSRIDSEGGVNDCPLIRTATVAAFRVLKHILEDVGQDLYLYALEMSKLNGNPVLDEARQSNLKNVITSIITEVGRPLYKSIVVTGELRENDALQILVEIRTMEITLPNGRVVVRDVPFFIDPPVGLGASVLSSDVLASSPLIERLRVWVFKRWKSLVLEQLNGSIIAAAENPTHDNNPYLESSKFVDRLVEIPIALIPAAGAHWIVFLIIGPFMNIPCQLMQLDPMAAFFFTNACAGLVSNNVFWQTLRGFDDDALAGYLGSQILQESRSISSSYRATKPSVEGYISIRDRMAPALCEQAFF